MIHYGPILRLVQTKRHLCYIGLFYSTYNVFSENATHAKICYMIFLLFLYFEQEAAALAATQVAFVLNSGQRRGLHFAIAPGPPGPTVQQEQV